MNIEFTCHNCNNDLYCDERNKDIKCPHCNAILRVPARSTVFREQQSGSTEVTLGDKMLGSFLLSAVVCLIIPICEGYWSTYFFVTFFIWGIYWATKWAHVTAVGHFYFGKDPAYRQWIRDGGSPLAASEYEGPKTYTLPYKEPDYGSFVPPRTWGFQCATCYARIPDQTGCWNCGTSFGDNNLVDDDDNCMFMEDHH